MGRFHNLSTPNLPPVPAAALEPPRASLPAVDRANSITPPRPPVANSQPGFNNSLVGMAGFGILCLYLVSGNLNELSFRFTGHKSYLSLLCGILLPLVSLLSGRILRGFSHALAILWLCFLLWLFIDVPFSTWRGGSLDLVWTYATRIYVVFFYICALAPTVRHCEKFLFAGVVNGAIIAASALLFPDFVDGRLIVGGSTVFDNPNDLAIALLLFASFLLYFIEVKGKVWAVLAMATLTLTLTLILRTGSRGTFLGLLVSVATMFVFSRHRVVVALVSTLLAVVAVFSLSQQALKRLTFIFADADAAQVTDISASRAVGSRIERQHILIASTEMSFAQPLFGVGPGQFAEVFENQMKSIGVHVQSLKTHNTYTQLASECGLPALLMYCSALFIVIRLNVRLHRMSRGTAGLEKIAGMSYCLLVATVGYATSSFFHHLAYAMYFPLLGGMTLSLYLAAGPVIATNRTQMSGQRSRLERRPPLAGRRKQ